MAYHERDSSRALAVTQELMDAFGVPNTNLSEVAHQLFPRRGTADANNESDREFTNSVMDKLKLKRASNHRAMQADLSMMRESMERADSLAAVLLTCRKKRIFHEADMSTVLASPSAESTSASSSAAASHSSTKVAPSSPFLRRAASRDPIHRDKIKDEPISPSPLLQTNGTPRLARTRSNIRSQSMLTGQGVSPQYRDANYSTEKPSTATNPMFPNTLGSRPPVPVYSGQYQSSRLAKKEPPSTPSSVFSSSTASNGAKPVHPPPYPGKTPYSARHSRTPMPLLCREMRGALQGISGMYFVNSGNGRLIISATLSADEPMMNLFSDLLAGANVYIEIRRVSSRNRDYTEVSTMQAALLYSISNVLDDYVADLDCIHLTDFPSDILQLVKLAHSWRRILLALQRCLLLKDAHAIDLLDDLVVLYRHSTPLVQVRLAPILDATMDVFANALRQWVTKGVLANDEQWMIEADTGTPSTSNSIRTYRITRKPKFLDNELCQLILRLGISYEHVSIKEQEQLDLYRKSLDRDVNGRSMYQAGSMHALHTILGSMWELVGQSVVRRLMIEGQFLQHLKAARLFLLVDDPHFARALHNGFIECTGGLRSTLSQSSAAACFCDAVGQSPASHQMPFKVIIDAITSKNDSPNTSSRMQFIRPIHPVYRVSGLVARVFSGSQESYERLFHLIWSVTMSLFTIEDSTNRLRFLQRELSKMKVMRPLLRSLAHVAHLSMRVMVCVRQYLCDVIHHQFALLQSRLQEVVDVESAGSLHSDYLRQLEAALFIDGNNGIIYGLLNTAMQQTFDLSHLVLGLEQEWQTANEKGAFDHTNRALETETLREFEIQEQLAVVELQLVGSRSSKAGILRESLTQTLRDLSEHTLQLSSGNPLIAGLVMDY